MEGRERWDLTLNNSYNEPAPRCTCTYNVLTVKGFGCVRNLYHRRLCIDIILDEGKNSVTILHLLSL